MLTCSKLLWPAWTRTGYLYTAIYIGKSFNSLQRWNHLRNFLFEVNLKFNFGSKIRPNWSYGKCRLWFSYLSWVISWSVAYRYVTRPSVTFLLGCVCSTSWLFRVVSVLCVTIFINPPCCIYSAAVHMFMLQVCIRWLCRAREGKASAERPSWGEDGGTAADPHRLPQEACRGHPNGGVRTGRSSHWYVPCRRLRVSIRIIITIAYMLYINLL